VDTYQLNNPSLHPTGKISGPERNEMILISDVLGLEALLDTMTQARLTSHAATPSSASSGTVTMSAILGPFYRTGAPEYKNGESMVLTNGKGDVSARVFGRVLDVDGRPVVGAKLE
jgi:catechol 1,2-dioxygenase